MTAKQLAETLTTIAEKAKALREAGVVGRVQIGDVSFEVGELEQPAPVQTTQPSNGAHSTDAFEDPDTYGGYVPTRRRPEEQQFEDED
jgi:hypothetical protein